MDNLAQRYLEAMGVTHWVLRTTPSVVPACSNLAIAKSSIPSSGWDELQQRVAACKACSLHQSRTQTVFGVGSHTADLLIVGEAPGANEDRLGEPFVGRAGHLLDAMLNAIKLHRQQVFIANILKCRPPNNRDPSPEEVALCTPFLQQQIALLKPKLILALGRVAAHHLLQTNASMASMRGKKYSYGESAVPLIVTFHPAYLLRSPLEKRKAWQDLSLVNQLLNEV